jgi:lysophospholipid acyltransferase (LPLAT)-like uncharacterized protein
MAGLLKSLRDHLTGPAAILIGLVIWCLGRTCRLRLILGEEHLSALLDSRQPVVICFWHNRSVMATLFTLKVLRKGGLEITALASKSQDGELVARLARVLDFRLVRGSTSSGGQQAFLALHRAIVRRRSSPVVIPDGPRGPRYVAKPGAVILAQLARVPILPLSFAAERFWTLKSWDRLMVPKPFTSIVAGVGELQAVPRRLSDVEKEGERVRLEESLDRLGEKTAEAAGL